MPPIVSDLFGLVGLLLRAVGFLVFGFGSGSFVLDTFKQSNWQLQIALVLGFFGLLIGLTDFSSPGSAGAFALGAGVAYFMANMPKKTEGDEEKK